MKVAGIIAEYNPFHNGHAYQIAETRQRTGADYVVVAMSGDFLQRGCPGIVNKYDRARMALEAGADLVIQLPIVASLSSAEGFATGGVNVLQRLGVVTDISFGCEAKPGIEQKLLEQVGMLLAEEPVFYRNVLEQCLKQGMSYPAARQEAILSYIEATPNWFSAEGSIRDAEIQKKLIAELVPSPNNILATEYIKAIRRSGHMTDLCMITREGSGYHDEDLDERFASATAIRKLVREYMVEVEGSDHEGACFDDAGVSGTDAKKQRIISKLKQYCPDATAALLIRGIEEQRILKEDDFSDMLYLSLIQSSMSAGSRSDLDHRMEKLLEQFDTWSNFALDLKTRNQTLTAIQRYLACKMTGITHEEWELAKGYLYAPYIRLLGYRKDAGKLIAAIQDQAELPLIRKPAEAGEALNPEQMKLFRRDLAAAELYRRVENRKSKDQRRSDYRMPLVLV